MKYTIRFPENYIKPALPGRDLWIAALRSGQYRQGIGALSNDGKDCCLGVLCKVQKRPMGSILLCTGGPDRVQLDFDGERLVLQPVNPLFEFLNKSGNFPADVTVYVESDDGQYHGCAGRKGSLSCCNDSHLNFLQIADIIEAVWENAPPNWNPCPPHTA